jgi:hypothetical protein
MTLREKLDKWAELTCRLPDVRKQVLKEFDRAAAEERFVTFLIGAGLTRYKKAVHLTCLCGCLYSFELSEEQAERREIRDLVLTCEASALTRNLLAHDNKPIELVEVTVDNASPLDRHARIRGEIEFAMNEFPVEPLVAHGLCNIPGHGTTTLFHYFPQLLPPGGTAGFSFDPLGDLVDRKGHVFSGVLPIFFQIWTTEEPNAPNAPLMGRLSPAGAEPAPSQSWNPIQPHSISTADPLPPVFPPTVLPLVPAGVEIPAGLRGRPMSNIRGVIVEIEDL